MSETQTTELMQDSALFDDVAKQALGRYEFDGDEVKLLTFSENYTYLVRNPITGSKDAVLRISRPGYHTLEELEGEMAWLRQINDYTPPRGGQSPACARRQLHPKRHRTRWGNLSRRSTRTHATCTKVS